MCSVFKQTSCGHGTPKRCSHPSSTTNLSTCYARLAAPSSPRARTRVSIHTSLPGSSEHPLTEQSPVLDCSYFLLYYIFFRSSIPNANDDKMRVLGCHELVIPPRIGHLGNQALHVEAQLFNNFRVSLLESFGTFAQNLQLHFVLLHPQCTPLACMWEFLMHIAELLLKSQHRGTLFLSSLCKIEHRITEDPVDKNTRRNLSRGRLTAMDRSVSKSRRHPAATTQHAVHDFSHLQVER